MKAVVIGGGIIGLCAAYYLRQSGWDVTVLDSTDLSDGCSYGNMGMIVPSHFVPLAAPGMLTQGIRWMFNSKSPFYIKPSLKAGLIPWGLQFIKSSRQQNVDNAAVPLKDINLFSKALYEHLSCLPGFDFALEKKGILMYYRTPAAEEEEGHLAEKARSLGLDAEVLDATQVQKLESKTKLDILGAVHYRCDAHLYPNKLIPQLIYSLTGAGVQFSRGSAVERMVVDKQLVRKVVTANGEYDSDVVVAAAGAWLPQITKMAGVKLLMMPGKGYSFTFNQPLQKLNIPAILCEARVAITPMNGHMRYGGTMEIATLNNKVNMNRVEGIVRSVPKYFPEIKFDPPAKKDIWYGFRPCTPDGLPYIGYSRQIKNMIIAGGHAMSGLSLGPATGKLVAELADQKTLSVNITAFDPNRFS